MLYAMLDERSQSLCLFVYPFIGLYFCPITAYRLPITRYLLTLTNYSLTFINNHLTFTSSTHQLINSSTHQLINLSTNQLINHLTSTNAQTPPHSPLTIFNTAHAMSKHNQNK